MLRNQTVAARIQENNNGKVTGTGTREERASVVKETKFLSGP
jgi:hypothetical protein